MEEKNKKVTKKEYYLLIQAIIEKMEIETKEDILNFIEKQIAAIDNKAEKAKERAAEKKNLGDELREQIKSLLTKDYQTANEITNLINNEEVSKAKVIARLTQLVNNGDAEKADIKTEDGKNLKGYKLID